MCLGVQRVSSFPAAAAADNHTTLCCACVCSIVGFTSMSKEVRPDQVMAYLNELFTAFDALVDTYEIYKVRPRHAAAAGQRGQHRCEGQCWGGVLGAG